MIDAWSQRGYFDVLTFHHAADRITQASNFASAFRLLFLINEKKVEVVKTRVRRESSAQLEIQINSEINLGLKT